MTAIESAPPLPDESERLRISIVGDGGSGKTVLLCAYTKQTVEFGDTYIPTVLDTYTAALKVGEQDVNLEIFDTAGQEDFKNIRKAVYPSTDVFILCYDCVSRGSLDNTETFWFPEMRSEKPNAPIVLTGNKLDLRTIQPKQYVKPEEAEEIRLKINSQAHVQCSARQEVLGSDAGMVDRVFKYAIKFGLQIKRPPPPCCCQII